MCRPECCKLLGLGLALGLVLVVSGATVHAIDSEQTARHSDKGVSKGESKGGRTYMYDASSSIPVSIAAMCRACAAEAQGHLRLLLVRNMPAVQHEIAAKQLKVS